MASRGSLFDGLGNHGNIVLNFLGQPIKEFPSYAEHFWKAGQLLKSEMLDKKSNYHDLEGCPILFLYRHAAELYLKAIALQSIELRVLGGEQLDKPQKELEQEAILKSRHALWKQVPAIKRALELSGQELELDIEGLRTFDQFAERIDELDKIDPNSFAFRYPVRLGLDGSVPHHFIINIRQFCTVMDGLLGVLDALALDLGVRIEQQMG
jgi:hypothetical protein